MQMIFPRVCTSMIRKYHFARFLAFLLFFPCFHAQCPSLPSGFCFVDCTSAVFKIVCEDVLGVNLFTDISVYNNTRQSFELSIWNSPRIVRISSALLLGVEDLMIGLYLENIINLLYFPELRYVNNLLNLKIVNSPKLRDFPVELLPPQ